MSESRDTTHVEDLYHHLLQAWNRRSAGDFAALFASDGNVVGFDGSQMDGAAAIESSLLAIFADHEPAKYIGVIREVRFLSRDIALLRAAAGMVPAGTADLNDNLTIQSLVASRQDGRWWIALWHNTPAAFHGRPEARQALMSDLRGHLHDVDRDV